MRVLPRILAGAVASALLATSLAVPALGASHREAPLLLFDPSADITDLYAFVSPDEPDTVTLIANYIPFQEPAAGPNFYPFNPGVAYWIKVDNTGDGVEDITYTFAFETHVANPESFLYSGYGPIPDVEPNVTQTFSVARDDQTIAQDLYVPPPKIGPRTTPDYRSLAAQAPPRPALHPLGESGQVFAGQRDDPFFADLGAIFDLGGLRPFNQAHLIPLEEGSGIDTLAGFNVNSIAIQVPKTELTNDGMEVSGPEAENAVIGVWAGASRLAPSIDGGPGELELVQVSRLGNPLINEVIIPIGQKDEWNASSPSGDVAYIEEYLSPELAAIINTVYPDLPDARTSDREDLVLILGRGIPGLNQTNEDGLYDMLRLNMGIPPTENPDRLGAVAGDLAGFPNGRRVNDDVVDIELRAVADGYGAFLAENFGLPNLEPNNQIGDGCDRNDSGQAGSFSATFPYLVQPHSGYEGSEYRPTCVPGGD